MKTYYIAFTVFDDNAIHTEEISFKDNDKINSDTIKEALENLYRDEYYYEGGPNIRQVISWSKIE
jgi:hypothetical protein